MGIIDEVKALAAMSPRNKYDIQARLIQVEDEFFDDDIYNRIKLGQIIALKWVLGIKREHEATLLLKEWEKKHE